MVRESKLFVGDCLVCGVGVLCGRQQCLVFEQRCKFGFVWRSQTKENKIGDRVGLHKRGKKKKIDQESWRCKKVQTERYKRRKIKFEQFL